MGRIVEELILEDKKNSARRMLKDGLPFEDIARYLKFTVKEVEAIAKEDADRRQ